MFCKHEWDKVSEVTLPSAYEQIRAAGQTLDEATGNMWRKIHSVLMTCKKCGKIYQSVVRS